MSHDRFMKDKGVFVPVGCKDFVQKFHDILHDCWDQMEDHAIDSACIMADIKAKDAPCRVVMLCAVIEENDEDELNKLLTNDLDVVVRKYFNPTHPFGTIQ